MKHIQRLTQLLIIKFTVLFFVWIGFSACCSAGETLTLRILMTKSTGSCEQCIGEGTTLLKQDFQLKVGDDVWSTTYGSDPYEIRRRVPCNGGLKITADFTEVCVTTDPISGEKTNKVTSCYAEAKTPSGDEDETKTVKLELACKCIEFPVI